MNAAEVVDLINNHVTYRREWTLTAEARYDGRAVLVVTRRRVPNSTPRQHGDAWWSPHVLASSLFTVTVDDDPSRDEVLVQVLRGLVDAEAHEAREFLRVDDEAPLHPHRRDSDGRFRRAAPDGLRVTGRAATAPH